MADYGPGQMQTPWGNADQLRERMLRPGPGIPRDEVARSQRERLFAATVACIADKGYEATVVADLLELSGVSRSAFYEHFHDKEDCLLATFDAIVAMAIKRFETELAKSGTSDKRGRNALDALLEAIVRQPDAARLCFSDVYTVGERGRLTVERAMQRVAALVGEMIGKLRGGREMPADLVLGLVGGAQSIIQSHLRRGDVDSLIAHADDLWDWALSYEPPGTPLRVAGRRARPVEVHPPPFVAYSQAERIIRALAASAGERGYPAVTIAEIAARASVSQATFYSHFADKHAALVAALDSAGSQMLGFVLPAARRASDWENGVRAAIGALCAFYASEPNLARLVAVETYAAGPAALDQRDRANAEIRALLKPGLEVAPQTKPIVADAALGAVWTLLYAQIVNDGPQALPQAAPLASYMVLAPFLGAEKALKVSNGDGRARGQ
jgi:AcrR family transcriptional regulator